MADPNRDAGDEEAEGAEANLASNDVLPAKIVSPAAIRHASERLLTRGRVARRLGLSLTTMRRMESAQLRHIVDERCVRYLEETEIQTVRVRRTRMSRDERASGTLAAASFALFWNGANVVAVVEELREAPEKTERLFEHRMHLRVYVAT